MLEVREKNKMVEEKKSLEEVVEETKSKYGDNRWWDSDDPNVLFLGQINEPILLVDFVKFHKATEKALGRPVFTHEFAASVHELLIEEFEGKIPKPAFDDILAKIKATNPDIKTILVEVK